MNDGYGGACHSRADQDWSTLILVFKSSQFLQAIENSLPIISLGLLNVLYGGNASHKLNLSSIFFL
jgi:hypothetical protein